jgi:hypothetical protein
MIHTGFLLIELNKSWQENYYHDLRMWCWRWLLWIKVIFGQSAFDALWQFPIFYSFSLHTIFSLQTKQMQTKSFYARESIRFKIKKYYWKCSQEFNFIRWPFSNFFIWLLFVKRFFFIAYLFLKFLAPWLILKTFVRCWTTTIQKYKAINI